MTGTSPSPRQSAAPARLTARALLVGERIDTAGLERSDLISTTPLAFRIGPSGYCVLFRYGVIVLVGLSPLEGDELGRGLGARIVGRFARTEDEPAVIGWPFGKRFVAAYRFFLFAGVLSLTPPQERMSYRAYLP